ncbi:MAG: hypothetical protein ACK4M7_09875, partial [Burkholderiales bacterium]
MFLMANCVPGAFYELGRQEDFLSAFDNAMAHLINKENTITPFLDDAWLLKLYESALEKASQESNRFDMPAVSSQAASIALNLNTRQFKTAIFTNIGGRIEEYFRIKEDVQLFVVALLAKQEQFASFGGVYRDFHTKLSSILNKYQMTSAWDEALTETVLQGSTTALKGIFLQNTELQSWFENEGTALLQKMQEDKGLMNSFNTHFEEISARKRLGEEGIATLKAFSLDAQHKKLSSPIKLEDYFPTFQHKKIFLTNIFATTETHHESIYEVAVKEGYFEIILQLLKSLNYDEMNDEAIRNDLTYFISTHLADHFEQVKEVCKLLVEKNVTWLSQYLDDTMKQAIITDTAFMKSMLAPHINKRVFNKYSFLAEGFIHLIS